MIVEVWRIGIITEITMKPTMNASSTIMAGMAVWNRAMLRALVVWAAK